MQERLLPAIEEMASGLGASRPNEYTYQLHDLITS
jgi:hypothetical protein